VNGSGFALIIYIYILNFIIIIIIYLFFIIYFFTVKVEVVQVILLLTVAVNDSSLFSSNCCHFIVGQYLQENTRSRRLANHFHCWHSGLLRKYKLASTLIILMLGQRSYQELILYWLINSPLTGVSPFPARSVLQGSSPVKKPHFFWLEIMSRPLQHMLQQWQQLQEPVPETG